MTSKSIRKNARQRPPRPDNPTLMLMQHYGKSETERRRHKNEQRYVQAAEYNDLVYAVALRDGGFRCARCGATKGLRLDHIRPICRGGKTVVENLQLLCCLHDIEKGDRVIDYRPKSRNF